MRRRPFFALFVTPGALTALVFTAALVAVLQYSVRAHIPGSLDVGGFTLDNFTAMLRPLYGRVFLNTLMLCVLTAVVSLLVGYPLAYALVHSRSPVAKSIILVTVVMGGWAAWMTGRACALTWRPWVVLVAYLVVLACAVRFIHMALFEGTLLSLHYYLIDLVVVQLIGAAGYRYTRVRQMAAKHGWMFERVTPLTWRRRLAD